MGAGYVSAYFAQSGIECLTISNEIKQMIDKLRSDIYDGKNVDSVKTENCLANYFGNEKNIVLACTELSVLFSSFNIVSFYDMAEEQINYIINTKQ
jgi:aspartate/glutamate racemase